MRYTRRILLGLAALACVLAALLVSPRTLIAQASPGGSLPETGTTISGSARDILESLRQSGLSREQAKQRLRRFGYDPSLVDQYYDQAESGVSAVSPADSTLHRPLRALEVRAPSEMGAGDSAARMATPGLHRSVGHDSLPASRPVRPDTLEVFGLRTFRELTSQFEADVLGPVDPSYRLGPGDEVVAVLTGEVEQVHSLSVTREGFVLLPNVGRVQASGLTLAEFESTLLSRLAAHYSGISSSPGAAVRLSVSMGRVRSSLVRVIGEAVRPGAYQVPATGTVLDALYRAGGPGDAGSLRRIEVRRGGKLIHTLDLYGYLLRGETSGDVRIEHGDVIFIPVRERTARVVGGVRRSALYEVLEGESVRDVLNYAGGLGSRAVESRVQVDRVLAPEARVPGVDRVVLDVRPSDLATAKVLDGDILRVFTVGNEVRNRILLSGEVHRPGAYQWSEGLTLVSLLQRAGGMTDRAYSSRVQVYRFMPRDSARQMLSVSGDDAGFLLEDRDSVVVHSAAALAVAREVAIAGFVKRPGVYRLAEGMTLQDLILAAGGFARAATRMQAELARLPDPGAAPGSPSEVLRIDLGGVPDERGSGVIQWTPASGEIVLRHGDLVAVYSSQPSDSTQFVTVAGEVARPGAYALGSDVRFLSGALHRAGGAGAQAFVEGAYVIREGSVVETDLARALRRPGGKQDLLLMGGDSIVVPRFDGTVLVTGGVAFETRVRYQPGASVGYYIERAGGFSANGDRRRVSVTHMSGLREVVRRRTLLPDHEPKPGPGSIVYVSDKPVGVKDGTDWTSIISRATSVLSATATLIIALNAGL